MTTNRKVVIKVNIEFNIEKKETSALIHFCRCKCSVFYFRNYVIVHDSLKIVLYV